MMYNIGQLLVSSAIDDRANTAAITINNPIQAVVNIPAVRLWRPAFACPNPNTATIVKVSGSKGIINLK